jgi:CubicO group peptidase (beta-lactamase class C family)
VRRQGLLFAALCAIALPGAATAAAGAPAPTTSAVPAASAAPAGGPAPSASAAPVPTATPVATAAPTLAQALAAIAAYAPQALKDQGAPGVSIAITDRTHVLSLLTLGFANVASQSPVTPQTRFPIGSITKSMTALSLMQKYDAGELNLDAPVTRYLPDFSIHSNGKPVLVHQLLSHTAGLPDDYSVSSGYGDTVYDLQDATVLFPPGSGFSYSNDGYVTAGAILAKLDRRSWNDAVVAHVFIPLGMSHTSPVFTPENFSDVAVGYVLRDEDRPEAVNPTLVPSAQFDFVDPAGSVISTPADMAAYIRFYLNGGVDAAGGRLISSAAFARMTTPDEMNGKPAGASHPILDEAPELYRRYGFGLAVVDDGGDRIVAHTGGISGYTACMEANLTRGFGAIAMSNLVEAPLHPCAVVRYAMKVLRAQSLGQALPPPQVAADPAVVPHATDYGGTFRASDGTLVTISRDGTGAQLRDGPGAYRLYPRGEDTFWTDDPRFAKFLLVFYRDKSHVVTDFTAGSQQFVNPTYRGPTSFAYPPAYDALLGRYETYAYGDLFMSRVIEVKGHLTLDGSTPLVDKHDGTFLAGKDVIRFDHVFGGRPQRMWYDDIEMARIELP